MVIEVEHTEFWVLYERDDGSNWVAIRTKDRQLPFSRPCDTPALESSAYCQSCGNYHEQPTVAWKPKGRNRKDFFEAWKAGLQARGIPMESKRPRTTQSPYRAEEDMDEVDYD